MVASTVPFMPAGGGDANDVHERIRDDHPSRLFHPEREAAELREKPSSRSA
jgi:hypothetical protein